MIRFRCFSIVIFALVFCGCANKNPNKILSTNSALNVVSSVATGAGSGALIATKTGGAGGVGVAVGAGLGALTGGIRGLSHEAKLRQIQAMKGDSEEARIDAMVYGILAEHYQKRMELHPSRDIFPADLFFESDQVVLKAPFGERLVRALASLNKDRLPWSRLVVAVYTKSISKDSDYFRYLSESRAEAISDGLIKSGIEPKRIEARAVILKGPLVIDPADNRATRYNQAVEFIPLDR